MRISWVALLALPVIYGCSDSRPPVDEAAQQAAIQLIKKQGGVHSTYDTSPFTIEMVSIASPPLDDETLLKTLIGTPQLRILKLRSERLTDLALAELPQLTPKLYILEISGSPAVTDVGVKFLEDLPELNQLRLTDTSATPQAGKDLQGKLSDLDYVDIKIIPPPAGSLNAKGPQ
jgi:hypothetical protein